MFKSNNSVYFSFSFNPCFNVLFRSLMSATYIFFDFLLVFLFFQFSFSLIKISARYPSSAPLQDTLHDLLVVLFLFFLSQLTDFFRCKIVSFLLPCNCTRIKVCIQKNQKSDEVLMIIKIYLILIVGIIIVFHCSSNTTLNVFFKQQQHIDVCSQLQLTLVWIKSTVFTNYFLLKMLRICLQQRLLCQPR